jgi:hypothetical protein
LRHRLVPRRPGASTCWFWSDGLLPVSLYSVVCAVITWPLARDFTTKLAGNPLDPVQSLWNIWWWQRALETGINPFFTNLLWWPDGASLWFQTWDLPSIALTAPLWGSVPDVVLYNFALFATFPLAGFTFYLLCRELWPGSHLAAFLAGCLYTFSTYHLAHAHMTLHLASMEWSPLVVLGLLRLSRSATAGRWRGVWLTGIALALAAMASVYHALFSAATAILLLWRGGLGAPAAWLSRSMLARLGAAAFVFIALTGWLVAGMLADFTGEPHVGGHDPLRFSADLLSFVVPNPVSVWSDWVPLSRSWQSTPWETAGYVGFVTAGLALASVRFTDRSQPYLWIAGAGLVLALGPFLQVNGTIYRGLTLPEGWLEQLLPPLRFSGMPTRFSWLTTFGLAVAAGATLNHLCQRGRRGRTAAVLLGALALVEYWPRPFAMTPLDRPAMFAEWAADTGDWAVLDATSGARPLWHQMQHGRPIVAGYTTRTPERLWDAAGADPILGVFLPPPVGGRAGGPPPSPAAVQLRLRDLRIRFVVLDAARASLGARAGLIERARLTDLVVYEVPGTPAGAAMAR